MLVFRILTSSVKILTSDNHKIYCGFPLNFIFYYIINSLRGTLGYILKFFDRTKHNTNRFYRYTQILEFITMTT